MWPELTDRAVRGLKATDGKRAVLGDKLSAGLQIRCTPAGVKTWSFAYKLDGKGQRITLGEYPAMTLAKARVEANDLRSSKKAGKDPRAARDAARVERLRITLTVDQLCDKYVVHLKDRGKLSWKKDEAYLKPLRTKFGKRTAASITKQELLDPGDLATGRPAGLLPAIAKRSKSSANRTQSVLRTMWGWAAEGDDVPINFLAGVKKVGGKERSKDRVLTLDELRAFLAALSDPATKATPTVRLALRGILVSAQRPGEVTGMMESELRDIDGETPHWIIPRDRTKNKKAEQLVPLSPTAVQVVKDALEAGKESWRGKNDWKEKNDRPVFANRFDGVKTLARHSLSQAVRRILKNLAKDKSGAGRLAPFTPHDLRRTGATLAQSKKIPRDYVKALLNHSDGDVTEIYARWHMFDEKREAVLAIEAALAPLMWDNLIS
jgi:integrase